MNERKTESIVEDLLKKNGYEKINYQGSENRDVQRLLKSKKNNRAGKGKPEFTLLLNGIASDLLIIECKKDKKNHCSENGRNNIFEESDLNEMNAADYAVDGVIHYMFSVMSEYNVVGLAISGCEENSLIIDTYVSTKGKIEKVNQNNILTAEEYVKILQRSDYQLNEDRIMSNIKKELPILHNDLRDTMKLSEPEKPILISACLLALQSSSFRAGYKNIASSQQLAENTYTTIREVLKFQANVPEDKIKMMMSNFEFIRTNINVSNNLDPVIKKLNHLFNSFTFDKTSYDVIGDFYNEFMKYTGGDKQGLGIVLTPKHITELFCELAEITKDSIVLDTCTGTGAFLIAAMRAMILLAQNNENKINEIKRNQLIGIEQNPQMFTLACCNMILRHDGQSHIYNGSCFDDTIRSEVKKLRPNACLMNPPYSQKTKTESELSFIKNSLDLIEKNGKLVAIVPMSCAIEMSATKIDQRRDILLYHRLDAVFSMPDDLFYPVGTCTCIMVFTAHVPHGKISSYKEVKNKKTTNYEVIQGDRPTYFGYWRTTDLKRLKSMEDAIKTVCGIQ